MKFKELFDKEILNEEQHLRKELKIYYEINLELYKNKKEEEKTDQQTDQNQPVSNQPEEPAQPTQPAEANPGQPAISPQPEQPIGGNSAIAPSFSVVTEDEVAENDDNKIIRKFEGEVKLSDSQKDNIQSFEDVIDVLSNLKKDGTDVLDEFSSNVVELCLTQKFQEIQNLVDKKSKIFVEIYYGYKKDDSIGIRFVKRKNANTLTSTMLLDNEIISSRFSLDKVNQKVAEYRNYEAKK